MSNNGSSFGYVIYSLVGLLSNADEHIANRHELILSIMVLKKWNLVRLTAERMLNTVVLALRRYRTFGMHGVPYSNVIDVNSVRRHDGQPPPNSAVSNSLKAYVSACS